MLAFYDNIILEKVRGNNMEKEKNFLYKICKNIYSPIIKMLYRPKVFGAENIPQEGRLIRAGNHKNALDPTIVMSNTNRIVHFMAKEELFKGIHGIIFKNDLEIEFGQPIDVIGKQKEEANEYLRNEVLKLLEKKVGKNEIYIYNKSHSR